MGNRHIIDSIKGLIFAGKPETGKRVILSPLNCKGICTVQDTYVKKLLYIAPLNFMLNDLSELG